MAADTSGNGDLSTKFPDLTVADEILRQVDNPYDGDMKAAAAAEFTTAATVERFMDAIPNRRPASNS